MLLLVKRHLQGAQTFPHKHFAVQDGVLSMPVKSPESYHRTAFT